jgi:hypothetical protein
MLQDIADTSITAFPLGKSIKGFVGWLKTFKSLFSFPQIQGLFCFYCPSYLPVVFSVLPVSGFMISPFLPSFPLASLTFISLWMGNLNILWYDFWLIHQFAPLISHFSLHHSIYTEMKAFLC